ncbi:MAG: electron transfer flavoprotein subunit alpha/FixB family protein [Oscillospiraceae bacterium]|nr:electron transfer flavoprotein subunit alpha/FixB family protein [Oscillospiraceae bacterium]
MNKHEYKDLWVYIQHDGKAVHPVSLELCCEIRKIGDASREALAAVIVGDLPESEKDRVLDCGVDKIIHVSGTGYDFFNTDAYTNLFTVLCRKYKPSAVFVGGTIFGRDFAPRFACRLPTGCTSDATQLIWNPETADIEFVEPAVGGKMMAVITVPDARPQVGTIRPGTFKYAPTGRRACITAEEIIDFPVGEIRTKILDFKADEFDESLNIADADVIVCVGNGVKGADQLPKYRELAELLGGKLGCTRPVFDRGILPFKLVIGQSGVVIKPKLYLAFGVSGAVNHVTGITDSDRIVAVNKDPDAAIFRYCDYGIAGDMDEVCGMMIGKLKAGKKLSPQKDVI